MLQVPLSLLFSSPLLLSSLLSYRFRSASVPRECTDLGQWLYQPSVCHHYRYRNRHTDIHTKARSALSYIFRYGGPRARVLPPIRNNSPLGIPKKTNDPSLFLSLSLLSLSTFFSLPESVLFRVGDAGLLSAEVPYSDCCALLHF